MKLLLTLLFLHQLAWSQPLRLVPQPVRLQNGRSFQLSVPKGYRIAAAVEGLKRPRFFAKSPDGRLFVTDLYDRSDNSRGRVLILEGWNAATKRFDKVTTYLDGLHNPNQVAFYQRNGQSFIYVAETHQLSYYVYRNGEAKPSGPAKVIATFPAYGLHYKYGGWHLTRSLSFHNDKLYVSVGSSCNACIEKEEVRASVVEMDPDGRNARIYARGLRNSVGLKWVGSELWASGMGRDLIGPDKPEDLFHPVQADAYYGWPFYYQFQNKVYPDTQFRDSSRAAFVRTPPVAPWGFLAHSAPLGFDHFRGFSDTLLNNSFLVALHGSTSVWRQRGNAVVQLLPKGRYREIVSGFLQGKTEDKRYGRPCDVLQWNNQSFFISDDKNGVVYFVWRE